MKTRILLIVFVMFLVCFGGCILPTKSVQRQSVYTVNSLVNHTLTEKALPAIAFLKMADVHGQPISYGWGFFVSPIHIVTNFHVVAWTAAGTARTVDNGKKYTIKRIVAIDLENDHALIEVNNAYVKPLHLADSKKVQHGDQVYVVANPFLQGHIGTFYKDNISHIKSQRDKKSLLMTVSSSPSIRGSGLPVLNRKSEVIGVTFKKFIGGQTFNFVIPSEYLKALRYEQGNVMYLAQSKKYMSADTYFNRGNTKFNLKMYKAAISDYDTALKMKSDGTLAYMNRGTAKAKLGQTLGAKQDWQTALKLATQTGDVVLKVKIESLLSKFK